MTSKPTEAPSTRQGIVSGDFADFGRMAIATACSPLRAEPVSRLGAVALRPLALGRSYV
jgi:hypothetical protein